MKRSLVSGGPYIPVSSGSGISAPSFVDRGLANGTTYYYVVSAANFYGQSSDSSEVKVIPSFNVALLSAGTSPASRVSLAVLKDGSLWGWGSNQNLLLGPTTSNALSTVAFEISTPFTHPISSISTSGMHALALTSDGTVWAWGSNQFGELGNGTQSTAAPFNLGSPSPVSTLAGVIAIAAGGNHSLALKSDGTVWGWGDNSAGQLGNGTTTLSPTPVQVSMLTGIIAIAAGENHSLALTSDGYVWAWGLNTNGQLGNGTTTSLGVGQSSPVQVSALTGVAGISAGYAFSMALGRDGTVWVWGDGGHGELGNGTFASSPLRTQVLGLGEMTAVSAGSNHCLALQSDGTVWSWGFNLTGQLGNGTVSNITPYGLSSPGQVVSLTGVTAISGGGAHSLALRSDGSLVAWGDDDVGELGNGSGAVQVLPVAIPDLTNVLTISAGGGHSLAVDTNGKVWAWGDNTSGELGISSATQSLFPVLTSQQTGLGPVKAIAAGASFSMALVTNGAVWAWGDNFSGQLGNGSTTAQALVG
ncbi:MAG TPA: RCC1 repeat-containing protein, partial [Planctomycetota bacterium]|nr:RCC1 repeat-containing protein [Planctomycetota bacterium]